jgi:hypothetical protein
LSPPLPLQPSDALAIVLEPLVNTLNTKLNVAVPPATLALGAGMAVALLAVGGACGLWCFWMAQCCSGRASRPKPRPKAAARVVASSVRTQRRGSKYEWVGRANEEEEEEEEVEEEEEEEQEQKIAQRRKPRPLGGKRLFNKAMVFSKAVVFSGNGRESVREDGV